MGKLPWPSFLLTGFFRAGLWQATAICPKEERGTTGDPAVDRKKSLFGPSLHSIPFTGNPLKIPEKTKSASEHTEKEECCQWKNRGEIDSFR
jgi:hypothetical protein